MNTVKCIKEKRFLFWKYKTIKHNFTLNYIRRFADKPSEFVVASICNGCGAKQERYADRDELLLDGIPAKELDQISLFRWYEPNKQKTETGNE